MQCNLNCRHCYSASTPAPARNELTTAQAEAMIDDLASFGCRVLLLSGGEPLTRKDVLHLIARASQTGMRTGLSTNGTLITPDLAAELALAGLSYAGVSLDGPQAVNDEFRGRDGAFRAALAGIRSCRAAGLKVGLRLTMTGDNHTDIPAMFDLIEAEGVPRVCFYHLVQTGRGRAIQDRALTAGQTRQALDGIMSRAAAMASAGRSVEVLTVDNHSDGPYVYMRLLREDPARAATCLELLEANGGNRSGIGIGCVDWEGQVLPDQFWRTQVLGNVLERPFSEIWSDPSCRLLGMLRNRKEHLKCRCLRCRWLGVCNGNLRARAEAATGDPWGDDPACYLSDQEIS